MLCNSYNFNVFTNMTQVTTGHKRKENNNSDTSPSAGAHLDDAFGGEHVGFDLGQEHEAEVQRDVRLGAVQLQLLHGSTQQPLDAVVVTVRLCGLDVVQQDGRGDCGRETYW